MSFPEPAILEIDEKVAPGPSTGAILFIMKDLAISYLE
jgi:hypothetical protein